MRSMQASAVQPSLPPSVRAGIAGRLGSWRLAPRSCWQPDQVHLALISQPLVAFEPETVLLQQLLAARAVPGAPTVYVVEGDGEQDHLNGRMSEVMHGYGLAPTNLTILAPDEALALPALCAGDEPRVLLIWPTPHP